MKRIRYGFQEGSLSKVPYSFHSGDLAKEYLSIQVLKMNCFPVA